MQSHWGCRAEFPHKLQISQFLDELDCPRAVLFSCRTHPSTTRSSSHCAFATLQAEEHDKTGLSANAAAAGPSASVAAAAQPTATAAAEPAVETATAEATVVSAVPEQEARTTSSELPGAGR